ncbi:C-type lectin domain family 4 member E-like isoform X2 [Acipenser ruthenus]|uniref:C-type lectin domain family 4 member E-like isoform X2 n=1 Tax=Acipenser ruthenus TaxID=7906 RepID=UPI002741B43E|nr:C-type lectin domain family 4 member E-like isoform X2 [Acipenser ruthenus]
MEMDSIYTGLQNPSEDLYSTVNQPQGKRSGAEKGDPTAGKAPPYRWAALVLAGLCALSVAAIIFLSVYILHMQTKYSELERNYTNISATVLHMQTKYSELERNYTNISATVSNFQTKNLELQSQYSELERNYTDIAATIFKACPQNWELFNGKCYYFSTDRMNWTSSRDNCTSLGGHLVIIESDGEQRSLTDKALIITQEAYRYEEKSYWIGLTDAVTEGTWLWVDGTPLIGNVKAKFWATRSILLLNYGKEPDDYKGEDPSGEDCAQLQPQRNSYETWFDSSCKNQYKRICETKAVIH